MYDFAVLAKLLCHQGVLKMRARGFIIGIVIALCLTSSAHAVTLKAGDSYVLLGNIRGISTDNTYTGIYSLNSPGLISYFTVNFDNTISVVLNLIQADGDKATLTIDRLALGGVGTALTMNAPAGVTSYGAYKDIGNFFPVNNPLTFTNFAIAMPGQLNTTANTFKIWGSYFTQAGIALGGTDMHLTIGSTVTSQIPEPVSMSLLGIGLLGGIFRRKLMA